MKINSIILVGILGIYTCSHAGVTGLTFHSRANCGNNESISWHLGHSYLLRTVSYHYRNNYLVHTADTGLEATWRSAAVHWGEGTGGWVVMGEHYGLGATGKQILLYKSTVADCSIYDGWWDA